VSSLHSSETGGKEATSAVFECWGQVEGLEKGGASHENEGCIHRNHAVPAPFA
jgi:hypothetical protein